jgi:hypothetical protein
VTAGEGVQPGCMMKILEAERWLRGTNFHEVAFLQRQGGRIAGVPHPGGSEGGKTRCMREREDMVAFQGGHPPFKGDSPYLHPQPSLAVHATAQRLQAFLHFRPDQRVKGRTTMQSARNRAKWAHPLRLPTHPAWRPRHTRHATGALVTTCEQLHRHSHHYHASSTAEPVPRLEATLRMTQQCQPGATVNTAKMGRQ